MKNLKLQKKKSRFYSHFIYACGKWKVQKLVTEIIFLECSLECSLEHMKHKILLSNTEYLISIVHVQLFLC